MIESMDTRALSYRGPTLRAVLLVGFGLTLGMWLLVGYQFPRRIAGMQETATASNRRYSKAQADLATVRRQVLLGSVYVRDALLDPEGRNPVDDRAQIEEASRIANDTLAKYVPVSASTVEIQQAQNLRREIGEFRRSMLDAIASASREPANARALLRRELNPKRDVVIGMSEDLQALNRTAFIDQQQASANLYAITQGQMWRQLGLAMLFGLSVALIATMYASRLERRLRVQRDQEVRNAHDLQRLSARVIRVQEEERRAIARELHDEVGQVLTAIKVELAKVQRAIEAGGGDGQLLQNTRAIADGALHTVKDLSRLLHPAVLDDLGLSSAVEWHLKEFGRRHALRVEFDQAHMDQRLPSAVELAVYRVVQEALTNVARHASATRCSVSLRRWPEVLVVRIEDNGVGFDLGRPNEHRGLGLIGIRERVAELDGHLRIDSTPGRGTRVVIDLPVQPLRPVEFSFDGELPVGEPAVGGQVV